jgi:hypothetical protein
MRELERRGILAVDALEQRRRLSILDPSGKKPTIAGMSSPFQVCS